jgi:hypothetical protein
MRESRTRRRQCAKDLPVGCRTAIHVDDRQRIVGVLVDVLSGTEFRNYLITAA